MHNPIRGHSTRSFRHHSKLSGIYKPPVLGNGKNVVARIDDFANIICESLIHARDTKTVMYGEVIPKIITEINSNSPNMFQAPYTLVHNGNQIERSLHYVCKQIYHGSPKKSSINFYIHNFLRELNGQISTVASDNRLPIKLELEDKLLRVS